MGLMDTLFPGSTGSIMRKGASIAGGTGPVRMKKSPNIIQSLVGVLVGIVLVFGSPLAMWWAQSQHSADDFSSAVSVEADSGAAGYVTFRGAPSYANEGDGSACLDDSCIYQEESQQELVTVQELVCGDSVTSNSSMRILQQNGSECDEYGDCVPCYDVEKDEWQEIASIETHYDVKVGSYVIDHEGAIYFDTREKTVTEEAYYYDENDKRSVYTYYLMPSNLLVAGYSDGERVTNGELAFVLSDYDATVTLEKLEARDQANQMILWVITFVMLFIGLSLIFGPLAWMGRQMRYVPVIGPMLAKGSNAMIGVAAFVLAVPLWIALFVIIVLIKSWWIALILVALILAGIIWKAKKGQ
jgi:hypothetical protein